MPLPVCGRCQREMKLERTGVVVQFDAISVKGPYQQWHGDEARCPGCGAVVVFRYGDRPTWEHFHKEERVTGPNLSYVIPEKRGSLDLQNWLDKT